LKKFKDKGDKKMSMERLAQTLFGKTRADVQPLLPNHYLADPNQVEVLPPEKYGQVSVALQQELEELVSEVFSLRDKNQIFARIGYWLKKGKFRFTTGAISEIMDIAFELKAKILDQERLRHQAAAEIAEFIYRRKRAETETKREEMEERLLPEEEATRRAELRKRRRLAEEDLAGEDEEEEKEEAEEEEREESDVITDEDWAE
jgi:ribosomal protein L32E